MDFLSSGTEICNPTTGCTAGVLACNDNIICTIDSCNEDIDACDFIPSDAQCDDGIFCDGVETCDAAQGCVTAGAECATLDNFCGTGLCDETAKECIVTPLNEGLECANTDNDVCIQAAVCSAGECVELPVCNPQCELCDGGTCSPLCGNPHEREAQMITIVDALYILRASVQREECNLCICDVDSSMRISAVDTLIVLRYLVGLSNDINCPEFATIEQSIPAMSVPLPDYDVVELPALE